MTVLSAKHRIVVLSFFLLAVLMPCAAGAQEANSAETSVNPICQKYPGSLSPEELAEYKKACPIKDPAKLAPAATGLGTCSNFGVDNKELSLELQKVCIEDIKNSYAYAANLRQYNTDLYRWQGKANDDMRILVWVVVVSGLGMAIYQLVIVMLIEVWRTRHPGNAPTGTPPAVPTQQLEIGLGKIQLTSSIAGIVVLAISLVFLYLYVTEVYAIKPSV